MSGRRWIEIPMAGRIRCLDEQDQFCVTGSGRGQPNWRDLHDELQHSFERGFLDAPEYVPQGSHSMRLVPWPGFAPMLRTSVPREGLQC